MVLAPPHLFRPPIFLDPPLFSTLRGACNSSTPRTSTIPLCEDLSIPHFYVLLTLNASSWNERIIIFWSIFVLIVCLSIFTNIRTLTWTGPTPVIWELGGGPRLTKMGGQGFFHLLLQLWNYYLPHKTVGAWSTGPRWNGPIWSNKRWHYGNYLLHIWPCFIEKRKVFSWFLEVFSSFPLLFPKNKFTHLK